MGDTDQETPFSNGTTVHASALVLGRTGLLISGPSGSGKSTLAAQLIADWKTQDHYAAWICDDRVALTVKGHRLLASAPTSISGMAEMAHVGIVRVNHEPTGHINGVIRLRPQSEIERMPGQASEDGFGQPVSGLGEPLPAITLPACQASLAVTLVRAWLKQNDL